MRSALVALLAALAAAVQAASEASVWTFDRDSLPSIKPSSISPENARLILAHRLGLSSYHSLKDADESTINLLNNFGGAEKPLFNEPSETEGRRLLVIIEGLEDQTKLLSSSPSFHIRDPPTSSSNSELVHNLLNQDRHRRGAEQRCRRDRPQSQGGPVQGGFSTNDPTGACNVGSIKDTSYDNTGELEKLNVIAGDMESMSELVYGRPLPPSATADYTAIFHVTALEYIIRKHGSKGKEFKSAFSQIADVIGRASIDDRFEQVTVVGMPHSTRFAKRETNAYGSYEIPSLLTIRKEFTSPIEARAPQATIPANFTIPKTTIPSCWVSENACISNTANCTGHGSCFKKYAEQQSNDEFGAECWTCGCKATVIPSGGSNKTIYWGGPACQKKDISVPFFLFAGFTIAFVTAISYGIGMLYSIGQDDLPSVLGAGVPPTMKK